MPFRVGLLFNRSPREPFQAGPISSLLREIEERTRLVRNGESLTLVPFVRTNDEVAFSLNLSGFADSAEAAAWNGSGVVFSELTTLVGVDHPPRNPDTDPMRGIETIRSHSHLLANACGSAAEFDKAASQVGSIQNAWVLLVLISLRDNTRQFLEISPKEERVESIDWFLKVKRRWQTARPDLHALPEAKAPILGLLFPWLTSAIIRRRRQNVKRGPNSAGEKCRDGLGISNLAIEKLDPEDQILLNKNLERMYPFFVRHDELGKYYSNVFRTTCFLVPLLIAISTVLAVAAVVDDERHIVWHVVEAILLLSAAWLVVRSKISCHHAKWVEHRLTTELMRSSMLCSLLHTVPILSLPDGESAIWVRQSELFWTYLRSLPALPFTTASADLRSARRSAVAEYATYQETFHKDFADQHYQAQEWLVKTSGRAFFVTLCLVAAQLAIAHLAQPNKGPAVKLMMATLICGVGAFVLSLLTHQLGFETIAERSTNAAGQFRALRAAIDQTAHSADARQVYAWANDCAQTIVAEQHSWYRQIPLLRLDL